MVLGMIFSVPIYFLDKGTHRAKYIGMNIAITRKLFITFTITILNMNKETPSILDMFKAISMQISVWRWEARMIAKYGLDWGYKEPIQYIGETINQEKILKKSSPIELEVKSLQEIT